MNLLIEGSLFKSLFFKGYTKSFVGKSRQNLQSFLEFVEFSGWILKENSGKSYAVCLFILGFLNFCFVFYGSNMQVWNKIIMIDADIIFISG